MPGFKSALIMLPWVVTALEEKEASALLSDFVQADANKDGALSLEELSAQYFGDQGMEHVMGKKQLEALFKEFDFNGDNKIDQEEMPEALLHRIKEDEFADGDGDMPLEGSAGEEVAASVSMGEDEESVENANIDHMGDGTGGDEMDEPDAADVAENAKVQNIGEEDASLAEEEGEEDEEEDEEEGANLEEEDEEDEDEEEEKGSFLQADDGEDEDGDVVDDMVKSASGESEESKDEALTEENGADVVDETDADEQVKIATDGQDASTDVPLVGESSADVAGVAIE